MTEREKMARELLASAMNPLSMCAQNLRAGRATSVSDKTAVRAMLAFSDAEQARRRPSP